MIRPVAASLAVVVREHAVLLVQRRNPPDAGLWGCPGGRIETGETIMQAAARELLEETGVVGEARHLLQPIDILYRDANGALLGHFILLPVLCGWVAGEPHAASDALDAGWFALDSLSGQASILCENVSDVAAQAIRILAPLN